MINGIYAVNFNSTQDHGDGIIVADNGKVNGGDMLCVYRGNFKGEGKAAEAEIHVTLHSPGGVTIFGPQVRDFHLKLHGIAEGTSLRFSGHVTEKPELKISLTGRKLSDLG